MSTPLRLVREKRGLTIQEVAAAVNLDPGNLSRIERGQQVPNKDVTEKLAKFYGHEVTEMQIIYPERYVGTSQNVEIATSNEPEGLTTEHNRRHNDPKVAA